MADPSKLKTGELLEYSTRLQAQVLRELDKLIVQVQQNPQSFGTEAQVELIAARAKVASSGKWLTALHTEWKQNSQKVRDQIDSRVRNELLAGIHQWEVVIGLISIIRGT